MSSVFHKDLLVEIVDTWTLSQLDEYITRLEEREKELSAWILKLKTIRRKKTRKQVYDTGSRSGA